MHSSTDGDLLSDVFDTVLARQFKNIKNGDPYFYTNALASDQIDFVDHILFKDIICAAQPDFPLIQPFVFLTPGENNTLEACTDSFKLDLWKLSVNENNLNDDDLHVDIETEDTTEFSALPIVEETESP